MTTHGFVIDGHSECLTNTRYADDVLLYAKSIHEISEMLRLLPSELATIGLQMHADKTKILTTTCFNPKQFVHIGDMRTEV